MNSQEQEDDDLPDPEEPEESDQDEYLGSMDTEPCPFCKRQIAEGVDVCPHCGNFIVWEDHRRSRWLLITVLVLLGVFLIGLLLWGRVF